MLKFSLIALALFISATSTNAVPPETLSVDEARALATRAQPFLNDEDGANKWRLVTFQEQGVPGSGWRFDVDHFLSVLARPEARLERGGMYQPGQGTVHYLLTSQYPDDREPAQKQYESMAEMVCELVTP